MVYMIFLTRVEQGESSIVQFEVNEKNCKKFYEISDTLNFLAVLFLIQTVTFFERAMMQQFSVNFAVFH